MPGYIPSHDYTGRVRQTRCRVTRCRACTEPFRRLPEPRETAAWLPFLTPHPGCSILACLVRHLTGSPRKSLPKLFVEKLKSQRRALVLCLVGQVDNKEVDFFVHFVKHGGSFQRAALVLLLENSH